MREILFRGKRVDDGKWIEGRYVMYHFGKWPAKATIVPSDEVKIGHYEHVQVNPDTVGQFTGLVDKNGNRIFEGDILKSHYDFLFPDDVTFDLVSFDNSAWCIQQIGFEPVPVCADMISDISEVVGNIHDNQELLEGNRS